MVVEDDPEYEPVRTFTGAWIETCASRVCSREVVVRTFTGAWIETFPRADPL